MVMVRSLATYLKLSDTIAHQPVGAADERQTSSKNQSYANFGAAPSYNDSALSLGSSVDLAPASTCANANTRVVVGELDFVHGAQADEHAAVYSCSPCDRKMTYVAG